MTQFQTDFHTGAFSLLTTLHGTTVTYTEEGGSPASVTGIFKVDDQLPGYFPDAALDVTTATFRCNPADMPHVTLRGKLSVNGRTYAIKQIGARAPVLALQLEAMQPERIGGAQSGVRR